MKLLLGPLRCRKNT